MSQDPRDEDGQRLVNKMAWISEVFAEVEEWLDSRPDELGRSSGQSARRRVAVETLDLTIARERG